MTDKSKVKVVKRSKAFLAILSSLLWIAIIYNISHSTLSFNEQAPYCMGSTMLIFFLLNMIYKALDYWLLKQKNNESSF